MKALFPRMILVDFQNTLARCALVKSENLTRSDGYPSGHVYRFYRSILKLKQQYGGELHFCLEGSKLEQTRYAKFEGYKAGRTPQEDKGFNPGPDAMELIKLMRCKLVTPKPGEADDAIATLAARHKSADITIASSDKDLWACLRPKGKVRVLSFQKEIKLDDVWESYGIRDGKGVALVKALYGDSSDRLVGVPRLKWAEIESVMQSCYTPDDLFKLVEGDHQDELMPSTAKAKLKEYEAQIRQMYSVAKLDEECPLDILECPGDPKGLLAFLEKFECKSLFGTIDALTSPNAP